MCWRRIAVRKYLRSRFRRLAGSGRRCTQTGSSSKARARLVAIASMSPAVATRTGLSDDGLIARGEWPTGHELRTRLRARSRSPAVRNLYSVDARSGRHMTGSGQDHRSRLIAVFVIFPVAVRGSAGTILTNRGAHLVPRSGCSERNVPQIRRGSRLQRRRRAIRPRP